MRRQNEEKARHKFISFFIVLTLMPLLYNIWNAERKFKAAGVKEISSKRRQRLDKEHGINRDDMRQDFQKLDEIYRVSEKEEIKKYKNIGKTSKQFYED
jgi:hypothetical protein